MIPSSISKKYFGIPQSNCNSFDSVFPTFRMKVPDAMRTTVFPILFSLCLGTSFAQSGLPPMGGGELIIEQDEQCLSPEQRVEIRAMIDANKAELRLTTSSSDSKKMLMAFDWPLQKAAGFDWYSYYGISNFVDQDPTAGLLDYYCDDRTYDGHFGTDIFTWPFPWYMVENDLGEVIAAESGVIVGKIDGNDDDHCDCFGTWNAVYIQHVDGSESWYGHMKKGSLTTKGVGETVEKGEYLGVVASSGCSTNAHLHFEVYDGSGDLVDPYAGSCNSLNTESWWADQHEFRESKINTLLTHNAIPIHGCPGTAEEPYMDDSYLDGETVRTAAYYQDQQTGQTSNYRILQPDGTVWQSWTHSSPLTYNASWWYWTWDLPSGGPYGFWTFEVTYEGETYEHQFTYGDLSQIQEQDIDPALAYPNPSENHIIHLTTSESSFEKLELANASGQLVFTAATYQSSFDFSNLADGIYYLTIQSDSKAKTQRLVFQ